MKLKDIPDSTFFLYDVEKAKLKLSNVSWRDMYFKLDDYNTRFCRIIHISWRHSAVETILGKQTEVSIDEDDYTPKRVMQRIFGANFNYRKSWQLKQ